jgi:hypothetical protein
MGKISTDGKYPMSIYNSALVSRLSSFPKNTFFQRVKKTSIEVTIGKDLALTFHETV